MRPRGNHWFHKNVSKLIFDGDEIHRQAFSSNAIRKKMKIDLYMFGSCVEQRIGEQINGSDNVALERWSNREKNAKFS